jgi:predicted NUDIX family NTP pyrophosphohydrolase
MAKAKAKAKVGPRTSAGLLLYRRAADGALEVFLAHPGGPYWARKDAGHWTVPKGEPDPGEDLFQAALREFVEETGLPAPGGPFAPLGSIVQKGGKVVHAWASPGDADPAEVRSNRIYIEWPPHSGRQLEVPEIDRCAWFDLDTARTQIKEAQVPFLSRLLVVLL